jgi:hypothetical protein
MEPGGLLPCSQEPTTGPYPEPDHLAENEIQKICTLSGPALGLLLIKMCTCILSIIVL